METVGFNRRHERRSWGVDRQRREAWGYYRAVLRGRTGREYEELEETLWAQLQEELASLDDRAKLTSTSH